MQMNSNTLPFREPYVFPPKPEVLNTPKIYIKQLFIGFGIQLFVYSWVFGCLMYVREPKWFCMTVATLTSMLHQTSIGLKMCLSKQPVSQITLLITSVLIAAIHNTVLLGSNNPFEVMLGFILLVGIGIMAIIMVGFLWIMGDETKMFGVW